MTNLQWLVSMTRASMWWREKSTKKIKLTSYDSPFSKGQSIENAENHMMRE